MTIRIDQALLERACKGIIETILFCLPSAYKGTVYRVGGPPDLTVTRITSGIIDQERQHISWGLPQQSDYNPPGKNWLEYRDQPGRALEGMAWCVEKQKSWTAEDPRTDSRSVRLQVEGVWEDFHHMEPVLVRKEDLHNELKEDGLEYPRNFDGGAIWQHSEYIVVAIIKIHFRPYTIRIGSPETRLIKKLSRALGTELLSHQLREQSLNRMRQLAADKLQACNILAHSLRNAITKSGLILSLIKLELAFLRDQWENRILQRCDPGLTKRGIISEMNAAALRIKTASNESAIMDLIDVQNRFLELAFSPEVGEKWVDRQIEERWKALFASGALENELVGHVREEITLLKRSLYLGQAPEFLEKDDKLPATLKTEWVDLIYRAVNQIDIPFMEHLNHLLESVDLDLPYQEKSRKTLLRLKVLMEIMAELESDTNVALHEVMNGTSPKPDSVLTVAPLPPPQRGGD